MAPPDDEGAFRDQEERRRRKTWEDFMAGQKQAGTASDAGIRFGLTRFDQVEFDRSAPYLIKDFLPRQGRVVLWGEPKCGKSFTVLDMDYAIARGIDYHDRATIKTPTLYLAAEGARGLRQRILAYRQAALTAGEELPPIWLYTGRLDLVGEVAKLIADVKAQLPEDVKPGNITIDTLNRTLVGSESSDADMGAYLKACDSLEEAFGPECLVKIIHHCGIEKGRPRGHTSLLGAADCVIAIHKLEDGAIMAEVEAMKDGDAGATAAGRLRVVKIGEDEFGDPITSCVIAPAEAPNRGPGKGMLSPKAKAALDVLNDVVARKGELLPTCDGYIPHGARGTTIPEFRVALENRGIITPKDAKKGNPREELRRIHVTLQNAGRIGVYKEFIWPVTSVTRCPL
jgi:hypothetical protein